MWDDCCHEIDMLCIDFPTLFRHKFPTWSRKYCTSILEIVSQVTKLTGLYVICLLNGGVFEYVEVRKLYFILYSNTWKIIIWCTDSGSVTISTNKRSSLHWHDKGYSHLVYNMNDNCDLFLILEPCGFRTQLRQWRVTLI